MFVGLVIRLTKHSIRRRRANRKGDLPTTQSLARIALIARDYDEAIAWCTEKLGFTSSPANGSGLSRSPSS